MKKSIFLTSLFCLVAFTSFATTTLLDGFEDTNYTTATDGGDVITLSNSTDSSEGTNSLQVDDSYVAAGAWYYPASVFKTFASPVDLSEMEFFTYDINVPTADATFLLVVYLYDEQGYVARFVNWSVLGAGTSGWETQTCKLSDLEKNRWVGYGRAVNLKKITQVEFSIQRQAATSGTGTFTILLDNMNFVSDVGQIQELVLEGFQSYADDTALGAAWTTAFNGGTGSLDTASPYSGAQSLNLSASLPGQWYNYALRYDFSSAQDFSAAKYFKVAVHGDVQLATLSPTAHLYLVDSSGNRAMSFIWDWPGADEWSVIYLPFASEGIEGYSDSSWTLELGGNSCWREDRWDGGAWDADTDLSQIASMILSIETQVGSATDYPKDVTIGFDDVIVGYTTNALPVPSVKTYNVNVIPATGTIPVLDGTVGAGEWDLAASPGCTGFVHHDNNALAASEDPEVKALFNGLYLYILYQVNTAQFTQDFSPDSPGDDVNSTGDKFPFFLTPDGNMGEAFYRFSLVPNPADNTLYIWDEAALTTGYPGVDSWDAIGDSGAFTYDSGTNLLTMEYRIPWSAFNFPGNEVSGAPADGTEWGVQIGFSNEDYTGGAEYVNWEPDGTPGYVQGRPFGTWKFTGSLFVDPTGLEDWADYR